MKTLFYSTAKTKGDCQFKFEELCRFGGNEDTIVIDVGSNKVGYNSLKSPIGLKSEDVLVVNDFGDFNADGTEVYRELSYWYRHGVRIVILKLTGRVPTFNSEDWDTYMKTLVKLFEIGASSIRGSRLVLGTLGRKNGGFPKEWELYYNAYKAGQLPARVCIEKLNMTRSTFYAKIHAWEKAKEAEESAAEL